MNDLTAKIEEWATERNLHTADPYKQMLKLIEEVGEIASGMARGNTNEIKDGIGDVKVVITILKKQLKNESRHNLSNEDAVILLLLYDVGLLAREFFFSNDVNMIESRVKQVEYGLDALADVMNTTLDECTELAYNEIKDRKGKMLNGVFVKEADL